MGEICFSLSLSLYPLLRERERERERLYLMPMLLRQSPSLFSLLVRLEWSLSEVQVKATG